jgi:hypothetical protein
MNDEKRCYGAISMFSADSENCKACEDFKSCALMCRDTLAKVSELGDVDKIIRRHERLLASIGLIENKSRKTTNFGMCAAADELNENLKQLQVLSEGWISNNLENAPEYFRIVCEGLKLYGEMKSEEVVKNLQYKLPQSPSTGKMAMVYAAVSVQVLAANKIVGISSNNKKQVISWLIK